MDWTFLIAAAALVGTVANVYKKQWCFAVWVVTNTAWAVYDYWIGARWQAVQFTVYDVISVWGLIKWKKDKVRI